MVEEIQKLEGPQLASIEAQLHALLRQQAKRSVPVDLPRADFWHMCSQLLQTIEMELAEIGRSEGWSVRAQTLSRRQANLRHTISDLTRHRLAAFVNQAALSNLSSTAFGDAAPESSTNVIAIDWQRHDGAERAFHAGVADLIRQYKHNISWDVLQKGVLSIGSPPPMTPAGNAQLDAFVDEPGGLTGQAPPAIERPLPDELWEDPEIDDEDRIALVEEFPESPEVTENISIDSETAVDSTLDNQSTSNLKRIRVLKDMDSILGEDGEDIELFEGDTLNLPAIIADMLIEMEAAETAEL